MPSDSSLHDSPGVPTFGVAIEQALVSVHGPHSRLAVDMTALTSAILAMPEMQAIRAALHKAAWDIVDVFTAWDTPPEAMSKALQLPDSVIDWVLS